MKEKTKDSSENYTGTAYPTDGGNVLVSLKNNDSSKGSHLYYMTPNFKGILPHSHKGYESLNPKIELEKHAAKFKKPPFPMSKKRIAIALASIEKKRYMEFVNGKPVPKKQADPIPPVIAAKITLDDNISLQNLKASMHEVTKEETLKNPSTIEKDYNFYASKLDE